MSDNSTCDKTRRTLLGAGLAAIPVVSAVGVSLLAGAPKNALAADMVNPDSAQAKALSYASVSTKNGQTCSGCTLFQGDAGAKSGSCPLFAGEMVAAGAWCSAWVPKA